jgi:hypothetical protein
VEDDIKIERGRQILDVVQSKQLFPIALLGTSVTLRGR